MHSIAEAHDNVMVMSHHMWLVVYEWGISYWWIPTCIYSLWCTLWFSWLIVCNDVDTSIDTKLWYLFSKNSYEKKNWVQQLDVGVILVIMIVTPTAQELLTSLGCILLVCLLSPSVITPPHHLIPLHQQPVSTLWAVSCSSSGGAGWSLGIVAL